MAITGSDTLRIASASGSVTDRRHGLTELARTEDVQFIVGDWMSEYNMTSRAGAKVNSSEPSSAFEASFLESIEPSLADIARRRIKIVVNAGASGTKELHDVLVETIRGKNLDLKVAWVEGDGTPDLLEKVMRSGNEFTSLTTGKAVFPT